MGNNQTSAGLEDDYISIDDLFLAYRKAKADAFFERELCLHLEFLEYESSLETNLRQLHGRLLSGDWIDDPKVIGGCVFIPKKIDPPSSSSTQSVFTNSLRAWNELISSGREPDQLPAAEFRPIAKPSIDWLVISALWVCKAGHKFDSCLSDNVYGSRLRRLKNGAYNHQALGCFAPYAFAYKQWRERGIRVIEESLRDSRSVVALTADLKSFYHSINPSFVMTDSFREVIAKRIAAVCAEKPAFASHDFDEADGEFTRQVVTSLLSWTNQHQNLFSDKKPLGVPIGPSAARVIANLILLGFDRFIENEIQPLYYGRYVDDIFLVLPMVSELRSCDAVWDRIRKLSEISEAGCLISQSAYDNGEKAWQITLDYDLDSSGNPRSELQFGEGKQKAFFLEGLEGKALVNTIKRQIRLNSSEWRQLPVVPQLDEDIHADCLIADANSAEPADNLRKAEHVSIRRLRFALHLRDIEAISTDLDLADWDPVRKDLFKFAKSHLIAPRSLFTYAPYLQRIFSLGVKASAWDESIDLIRSINESLDSVKRLGEAKRVPQVIQDQLRSCKGELNRKFLTALYCSVPRRFFGRKRLPNGLNDLYDYLKGCSENSSGIARLSLSETPKQLLLADLAATPLRERLMHRDEKDIGPVRMTNLPEGFRQVRKVDALQKFLPRLHKGASKRNIPPGMLFPTRPLTAAEISSLCSDLLNPAGAGELSGFVQAIRGTQFGATDPESVTIWEAWRSKSTKDFQGPDIWVPMTDAPAASVKVCLPCLMVSDDSWIANVAQRPEPDLFRYKRLTRVINDVIRLPADSRPDYVVLPELSVKSRWFARFAQKLEKSGISLIAGIEYEHSPFESIAKNAVINSVRVSLVTDYPGYRTHLVFSQNKETPAIHEEAELLRINGKVLVEGKHAMKRIIRHGDFQFGILICSELTNINHRAKFRGTVDALFVPQWNRDVEGFSPLVESAATDLHLFVVQCNNRRYGDCRIRAPFREHWDRDVIRLKGGIHDYFSIGLIKFQELRRFQSSYRSPSKPFKPVPDGFKIHLSRCDLPFGEAEP